MARTLWKGTISFGLVTIPVKLSSAVEDRDVSFRQVHPVDGGRIRYKRVCEVCGEEVPYAGIAKGYEAADGRMAVLTKEDFKDLPLPSQKVVDITAFVDAQEIDPTAYDSSYYLSPDAAGTKPYVLLRDAMERSGRVAVVKVSIRSRETLALVRPVGEVLMLHTLHWPDEIRAPDEVVPTQEVTASDAEVGLAEQFIESLSTSWDPDQYTDAYRAAVEELVAVKLDGVELPTGAEQEAPSEVVDLMAMLQASIRAQQEREDSRAG